MLSCIFPPRCAICRKVLPVRTRPEICPGCEKELPRIEEPRCGICGEPMSGEFAMPVCADCSNGRPFVQCFVPFRYKDGIRRAIAQMKYYDRPGKYKYFAGEIAHEMGDFRPDVITFVPQNAATRRERGYNQTRLIAAALGRLLKIPVKSTLIRRPEGAHQVGLTGRRRRENARKLYRPGKKRLSGTWLLVDDVVTTGATMDACSRLLRGMGCEKVYAAAVAKTTSN